MKIDQNIRPAEANVLACAMVRNHPSAAMTRNGRQADRASTHVSSFAPKAQCDGAERARYQVMATLRQFILGGATKSLIETTASDPLFTLTTNSSARSLLDSHIE
jgi:hypothetical protein